MSSTIELEGVCFSYGKREVLQDVSFCVSGGERVAILGSSGEGKSTLLRLMAGITQASCGRLTVDGLPMHPRRGMINLMMQKALLLPWRTVLENVLLAAELSDEARSIDRARFLLAQLGLSDWESSYPTELSGGMAQRVALARTLLLPRPILLLDEPFQGLDPVRAESIISLILREVDEIKASLVLVTHDLGLATALADRLLVLNGGAICNEVSVNDDMRGEASFQADCWIELKQALRVRGAGDRGHA